jgi:hypothetical protein
VRVQHFCGRLVVAAPFAPNEDPGPLVGEVLHDNEPQLGQLAPLGVCGIGLISVAFARMPSHQVRPEAATEFADARWAGYGFRRLLQFSLPCVGLLDNLEHRDHRRGLDAHYPHLDSKKRKFLGRMLVEPTDGRQVRLSEARRDPDDRLRVDAGEVGHDLPEVAVIARRELVLDQHLGVVEGVARDSVGGEALHGHLDTFKLEREADSGREPVQVLGQPRGEVTCFMCPGVSQWHHVEEAEPRWYGHAATSIVVDAAIALSNSANSASISWAFRNSTNAQRPYVPTLLTPGTQSVRMVSALT